MDNTTGRVANIIDHVRSTGQNRKEVFAPRFHELTNIYVHEKDTLYLVSISALFFAMAILSLCLWFKGKASTNRPIEEKIGLLDFPVVTPSSSRRSSFLEDHH